MKTANVVTATASVSEVIRNGVDGRARRALVFAPSDPVAVVVLFHPFGFDPEAALFGERAGERLMSDLHGFIGPASALGLAVVAPAGDGRVLDGVSLAWPPHLDTAIDLAAELSDGRPVYTAGLSQGGLDALVAAGRRPDVVSGAYAVNPIVDVAAWHEDMVNLPVPVLLEMQVDELVVQEFGSTPNEDPTQYMERSAFAYADSLRKIPVKLVWSPDDQIVALQQSRHCGVLAERLRLGGKLFEVIQTTYAPDRDSTGRWTHEACDAWAMAGFFHDLRRGPT